MYDLLVFIGRFQPFHVEHKRVIDTALERAKNVLVLIGSCDQARTPDNPFTYEERSDMILMSYECGTPLYTEALLDYPNDDLAWAEQVHRAIRETALDVANSGGFRLHGLGGMKIGIIGAEKDDSSFYLRMFPEYELELLDIGIPIHATDIRENYFTNSDPIAVLPILPLTSMSFLFDFSQTEEYQYLCEWKTVIDENAELWASAPYPVKQVTVDAVVEHADCVLLVRRAKHPGKNLWALPGGHLEVGERTLAGAIRECYEETGLLLEGHPYVARVVFDDPKRSTMGHTISHAFHFSLPVDFKNTAVFGQDDAVEAAWVPYGMISRDMMFDDHYHIIKYFTGE